MSELLEALLGDLDTETESLRRLVADLSEYQWRSPTPAPGWSVAHQIAHLAWTDHAALLAATDPEGWDALVADALEDPAGYVDHAASELAARDAADLIASWTIAHETLVGVLRDWTPGEKIAWFGPPMSAASMATARFMETWAHGLDVRDALQVEAEPTDRVAHVAHLGVRTRDFAYAVRDLAPPAEPFHVALSAPGGDTWTWGPDTAEQSVRGSAWDFARLVTQRVHRSDTDLVATGGEAEHWLGLAQCFAGPAGRGRAPRD